MVADETKRVNPSDNKALLSQINHLLEESEEKSRRLMALTNLSTEIHKTESLEELYNILKQQIPLLIPSHYCSIYTINSYGLWETQTLYDEQEESPVFEMNNPILAKVISEKKSLMIDEQGADFLPSYEHKLIIPLSHKRIAIGTLQLAGHTVFDYEDLRLGLLLAFQISSIIDKFNQMQTLIITQQQLETYAQELLLQNEDIETYNHTIAHDLKSPLSTIPIKVDIIKKTEPSLQPSTMKHLDDIIKRVYHMSDMIDQLLILSTLRDNTKTMTLVNVNDVVSSTLERFIEVELGKITVNVQPNLPSIMGYAQWLEEAFANLIGNAIKYIGDDNPNPKIDITASHTDTDVTFCVTDNGIGIRTADQQKLFKMFTRLRDVESDGLGLGLAIVHRIIHKLDGKLGVESEWGKGTTFYFTLPLMTNKRFQSE